MGMLHISLNVWVFLPLLEGMFRRKMEWNEYFLPAFHFLSTNSQKGILKTISFHSIPSTQSPPCKKNEYKN